MKFHKYIFTLVFFIAWIFPKDAFAQTENLNQFINIVNPVRISTYTNNPRESIAAQYTEVAKRNLPATWLLTYNAILDDGIESVVKTMDKNQEIGLFLEITPLIATQSGVVYHQTDSWHRASSVFLSGYTQEDRKKLIDQIFNKFKEKFGFYPTSVGSWWTDSFSLDYIKNKYGVTANLTCADQFETDGYNIWGQYWSTPFYPNKYHAGIPANDVSTKIDLVTIQWAARDPLNGYGRKPASLFSTQDYQVDEYFQKLANLYIQKNNNKFGQITIGLEGDYIPQTYTGFFSRQLDFVADLKNKGTVNIVTMKEFAEWYRKSFPELSPPQIFESDDLLGEKIKSIWYQTPYLRAHLTYNYETSETNFLDLRFYFNNFEEPYYITPNRDLDLFINVPSIFDSVGDAKEKWTIFKKRLEESKIDKNNLILKYQDGIQIKFSDDNLTILGDVNNIPLVLANNLFAETIKQDNKFSISPKKNWKFSQEGLKFNDLTQEATNFLRQRKIVALEILIICILVGSMFFLFKRDSNIFRRLLAVSLIISVIVGIYCWYNVNTRTYFVPQSELDALMRLSLMPDGKIVVFDKVCLQCSFHTKYLPAVFANKRNYVSDVSKKKVVYNSTVFDAKTREEGREELSKLNASYIYAVRFEDYKEIVPFSPGDLNLEEIYSNANATVWRIRKN